MIIDEHAVSNQTDFAKELVALARLVTYARQNAQALQIDFPIYCLDLTLAALMEEMELIGLDTNRILAKADGATKAGVH